MLMGRRKSPILIALFAWLVSSFGASALAQAPLTFVTSELPSVTAGKTMRVKLVVSGGSGPCTFKLSGGSLPPGLKLNTSSGTAAGTVFGAPTTPGSYRFQVQATDSGAPPAQVQRDFTLVVTAALGVEWKKAPEVHGQKLEGSVLVTNYTEQDFTLTVIVMAVNEIGRATALGYQEFQLKGGVQQVILFGAEPGPGEYIVHADAVAEVEKTNNIYRARQQTAGKLEIQEPP
jgi:hypothetical protein